MLPHDPDREMSGLGLQGRRQTTIDDLLAKANRAAQKATAVAAALVAVLF